MIPFLSLTFYGAIIGMSLGLITAFLSGFGVAIPTPLILWLIGSGTVSLVAFFIGFVTHVKRTSPKSR